MDTAKTPAQLPTSNTKKPVKVIKIRKIKVKDNDNNGQNVQQDGVNNQKQSTAANTAQTLKNNLALTAFSKTSLIFFSPKTASLDLTRSAVTVGSMFFPSTTNPGDTLQTRQPTASASPTQQYRCFTPFSELAQQSQRHFFSRLAAHRKTHSSTTVGTSVNGATTATMANNFTQITAQEAPLNDILSTQLSHNQEQMSQIAQAMEQERQRAHENLQFLKKRNERVMEVMRHNLRHYDKKETQEMTKNKQLQNKFFFINPEKKTGEEQVDSDQTHMQELASTELRWELVTQSLDPVRPSFREGAILLEYHGRLYMYGGTGRELSNDLHIYQIEQNKWLRCAIRGEQRPNTGRYDHQACIYRHYMVIFGGQGDFNVRLKQRDCLNDISLLDLETFEWNIFRSKGYIIEHRRNAIMCVIGNILYIIGGISNKEEYLRSVYTVNFESTRVKSHELPEQHGLAYAVAVPVYKRFMPRYYNVAKSIVKLKSIRLREEGIFIFGGKNGRGSVKNTLLLVRTDEKNQPIEWLVPETQGTAPPARFYHTMLHYAPLNVLIVYGGRNDRTGEVFGDIWFLALRNLTWLEVKAKTSNECLAPQVSRQRYNHVAAISETKLFIFGGIHATSYANWNLYCFELDQFGNLQKRALNDHNKEEYSVPLSKAETNIFQKLIMKQMENPLFLLGATSEKKSEDEPQNQKIQTQPAQAPKQQKSGFMKLLAGAPKQSSQDNLNKQSK